MVSHVTCRLIKDYESHVDYDHYDSTEVQWTKLSQYHFVAAVGLNLIVSNNEGFNPSVSWIEPLLANGTKINPIVYVPVAASGTTPAVPVTSSMFNYTLALGGQLSGTQSNNATLTYQLDMQRVAAAALADERRLTKGSDGQYQDDMQLNDLATADAAVGAPDSRLLWLARRKVAAEAAEAEFHNLLDWCNQGSQDGPQQTLKGDLLTGDLALDPNIDNNLNGLDTVSPFNIYGASGPSSVDDVTATPDAAKAVQEAIAQARKRAIVSKFLLGLLVTDPQLGAKYPTISAQSKHPSDQTVAGVLALYDAELGQNSALLTKLPSLSEQLRDGQVTAAASDLTTVLAGDLTALDQLFSQLQTVPGEVEVAAVVGGGGGGKSSGSGPPSQSGSAPATSSFSSIVTFTVTAGANLSPSWSLLTIKGPGGGGGGGGGGAASGAAGGASSGGGGGSGGQFLSGSRSATDSLTVTFAPTCRTNEEYTIQDRGEVPLPPPPPPPAPAPVPAINNFGWNFSVEPSSGMHDHDALLGGTPHYPQYGGVLTIAPSSGPTGSALTPGVNSATGSVVFSQKDLAGKNMNVAVGSISWSLYQTDNLHWQLNGAVSNPQTQAAVGSIELQVTVDATGKLVSIAGKMSDDVELKLTLHQPTPSYWATIPGCDVATGNYIQTTVQNAARQTFNLMVAPGLLTQ
jgi:hypothetical protein